MACAVQLRAWPWGGRGGRAAHLDVAHHADDALDAQQAEDTQDEHKDDDALGALDDRQDEQRHGGEEVDDEGAMEDVEAGDDGPAVEGGAEKGAGEADGYVEAHQEVKEKDEPHGEVEAAGGGGDEVCCLKGGADGDPEGGVGGIHQDDESTPPHVGAAGVREHGQAEDTAAIAWVALLGEAGVVDGLVMGTELAMMAQLGRLLRVLQAPEFREQFLSYLALDEEHAEQGIRTGRGGVCRRLGRVVEMPTGWVGMSKAGRSAPDAWCGRRPDLGRVMSPNGIAKPSYSGYGYDAGRMALRPA